MRAWHTDGPMLSERNYGVSLLNDCKYGHDIKDNVIRMSLLKAATHPDHLQDQGMFMSLPMHYFLMAEILLKVVWYRRAYALNDPMLVVHGISDLGYESFVSGLIMIRLNWMQ